MLFGSRGSGLWSRCATNASRVLANPTHFVRETRKWIQERRPGPSCLLFARAGMACTSAAAHLLYAADTLRADPGFILAVVRLDGAALEYASEALRADRSIVLNAIRQGPSSLRFASPALQADAGILAAVAVRRCGRGRRAVSSTCCVAAAVEIGLTPLIASVAAAGAAG
mmetsp:Transcript_4968/g.11068  ORF Transcript_4968/g.11068 Transcript_4968/m.11068 type:complete len:170 (-) Transcript_4968:127-636(-)